MMNADGEIYRGYRVNEAVMSQQNVFAHNFLLKMKIQLKFFST